MLRWGLFPFAKLYQGVTAIRNTLYDKGIFRSFDFEVPTIGIGNLAVGGSGKTPHVEYLIRLLKEEYHIATLSRGYGRKTKGFLLADETARPESIGDEPYQFHNKFSPEVTVAAGEDRLLAVPNILMEVPSVNCIIFDDVFQHRPVRPELNILLTTWQKPFFEDDLLPMGWLRESRSGASRANAVVVTKCPENISDKQKSDYITHIRRYTQAETPVFFSRMVYDAPVPFNQTGTTPLPENILMVSGVAPSSEQVLKTYLDNRYKVRGSLAFGDHHNYREKDITKIREAFDALPYQNKGILTTEKDMVKLMQDPLQQAIADMPWYYLPVKVDFGDDEAAFNRFVKNHLKNPGSFV